MLSLIVFLQNSILSSQVMSSPAHQSHRKQTMEKDMDGEHQNCEPFAAHLNKLEDQNWLKTVQDPTKQKRMHIRDAATNWTLRTEQLPPSIWKKG